MRTAAERDYLFAGTLSSCGLKTQDELLKRGTVRNSASLSHEVQHIERKNSEPRAHTELEKGGN